MGVIRSVFSLVRLEELFRPVLHKESIDETWPSERQISAFFDSDSSYLAVTQNSKYTTLVSRLTVLETIIRKLTEQKQNSRKRDYRMDLYFPYDGLLCVKHTNC
jgi:hypothetical protein